MDSGWGEKSVDERFRLVRRLGEGGFGEVYEVVDTVRQEHVALKSLRFIEPEALYRFKKEFRQLADVSSPRLVALHELFAEGARWFFTMELIRGTDFLSFVLGEDPVTGGPDALDACVVTRRQWGPLRLGGADEGRLRWALGELAEAVRALHELGWLHRDLKPQNVMIGEGGRLVLLDFGLLTAAGTRRSTAGQVVGTVAYMSPEQAQDHEQLTGAADWYAVGAMLYEALTGRLPHRGSLIEMLCSKSVSDPPPPRAVSAAAPADLSALAMRLLDRDPRTRAGYDEVLAARAAAPARAAAASSQPSAAPDERPFVGREAELRALVDALGAVGRGRPVVVEVRGQSGMGKTALLERFLERAPPSAVVLRGRCYEREAVPYKALDSVIDSLASHLHGLDRAAAGDVMPRDVRALSRLFPVLERVAAVREAPAASANVPDPQELRQRAFAALGELLGRIGDRRQLIVAIDDLQWGDLDSAVALGNLLTAADPPGMLVLLAYRTDERERSPFLLELLCRTSLRAELCSVDLVRLPAAEAVGLARRLLALEGVSTDVAEAIAAEADGNPFFVQVLSHSAADRGRGAPVTLEGAISRLLSGLPQSARLLIETVAVAGHPVDVDLAVRAAGLESEGRKALDALRAGHLLQRCGGGDRVECYHDRVRELVVAELSAEGRRRRHAALARSLEGAGSVDVERLAQHLEGAGESAAAAGHYERAARQVEEKLAFERAARLYRKALELGAPSGHAARALRIRIADSLANAGLGWEAAPEYLAAAEGLGRLEALELRRRAAFQLLATGHFDRGCEVLDAVLSDLGLGVVTTPREAVLSTLLQRARLWVRGRAFVERPSSQIRAEDLLLIDTCWAIFAGFKGTDLTRVGGYTSKTLRLALDAGDPLRISLGLSSTAAEHVLLKPRSSRAQRAAAEALEHGRVLAEHTGDARAIAFNHQSRGLVAFYLCRFGEAVEASNRAIALYRERCHGVMHEIVHAEMHVNSALFYLGRLPELVRRVPGLLQEARARGDISAAIYFLGGYGFLAWLAGDDVETTAWQLRQARASWTVERFLAQDYLLLLAELLTDLYCGRGRGAWDRLTSQWHAIERSVWLLFPIQRSEWFRVRAASALAAGLETATGTERAWLLAEARRSARHLIHIGIPYAAGHGHLIEAGVEAALGAREKAASRLVRAEAEFASLGMVLHEAIARRGRGLLIGGETGRSAFESAEETLVSRGVANPARLAATLGSGLSSG